MRYNKQLVEEAANCYRDHITSNWTTNRSGVMGHRDYKKLKERALTRMLKLYPVARLAYDQWMDLIGKHNSRVAHSKVVNQPQETGRRLQLKLGWVALNEVLNKDGRIVLNAKGEVMGLRAGPKSKKEEEVVAPPPEVDEIVPPREDDKSALEAHKWRVLACATHGGVVPNAMGLAELLDISHAGALGLLDWLGKTHDLINLTNDTGVGVGGYRTEPKAIDAHKLLELFQQKDRNPVELRALEALIDVMQD